MFRSVVEPLLKAANSPRMIAAPPPSHASSMKVLTSTNSHPPVTPMRMSSPGAGDAGRPNDSRRLNPRTVRSAPGSIKNSAGSTPPPKAWTLAFKMGRLTPSSPTSHWPTIRIDAGPSFSEDVLTEGAIVIRVRGTGLGPRLRGCVSDECLLSRDDDVPSPRLGQDLRPMCLQPG